MKKGCVFNIQRYSLNDGEGIRTVVFLKGCKLKCPWCCNPESLSFLPEIMKKNDICLKRAICSNYSNKCPSGALTLVGKYYTVDELVKEVKRDSLFFDCSGGGVTFSGGEVLWQHEFVTDALKIFHKQGIHTSIETCGNAPLDHLISLLPYTDEILFDLKILDKEQAETLLGANLDSILANFLYAAQSGKRLIARIPLIPQYTATEENLQKIIEFLKPLDQVQEIHLLPYHKYGIKKYEFLQIKYSLSNLPTLSELEVQNIFNKFNELNKKTIIGG